MTDDRDWLAEEFERHRPRIRAVAYRMLGSLPEAEDVVQDAWVQLNKSGPGTIESMGAWLTTVVARASLKVLRTRRTRREQPLEHQLPEPIVDPVDGSDPEHQALLADSVGLALLIVLETLAPPERLAFVLHDLFGVPFDEIAPIVNRTPAATRQLASRARRRLPRSALAADADLDAQWRAAEAFHAAAREGDFKALLELLDPEVILRADVGASQPGRPLVIRGAEAVARQASAWAPADMRRVLVNGAAGGVLMAGDRVLSLGTIAVSGGKIVEIDILRDPQRLAQLDLSFLTR